MADFHGEALCCVRSGWPVFAGLDFRLAPGEALVLVGPNGAGKSSLLRIMAGLLRPAAGRLFWDGHPVADDVMAHAMRVHYVGHADAIKPTATVDEALTFWASFRGAARQGIEHRVAAALAAFRIEHLASLPGGFLSQGQRRRVALARLIATDAPLWLLDEPRTALDADALRCLDRVIADHRSAGGGVVMALHGGDHPPAAQVVDLAHYQDMAEC